jgi:GNAT superfamily N-acetyltransferase
VWAVRQDLEPGAVADLETLAESVPAGLDREPLDRVSRRFLDVLSRDAPVRRTWSGPAFAFPRELPNANGAVPVTPDNAAVLARYLTDWMPDAEQGVPMAVLQQGADAVSVCCSVRVTNRAHEAGVETHPDFRGRGHAARVVAAWAREVRARDRIPLYSTSWENHASLAVSRKLGLVQFSSDFHAT